VYLIAGLGNPGAEYARTRHNAGFLLVERLAARWRATWRVGSKFQARVARGQFAGRHCWLCQPQTFMNASGMAIAALVGYYRLALDHLLVVVDDVDLPLGHLRLRPEGSSGGHHGLESVEWHLGTRAYPRLRLGIGRRAEAGRQITGHVLGQFDAAEAAGFELALERAADQSQCWLEAGLTVAMNRFNGALPAPETKES
jgi:PTH1 family peptidyl-tRNA hydrolase